MSLKVRNIHTDMLAWVKDVNAMFAYVITDDNIAETWDNSEYVVV